MAEVARAIATLRAPLGVHAVVGTPRLARRPRGTAPPAQRRLQAPSPMPRRWPTPGSARWKTGRTGWGWRRSLVPGPRLPARQPGRARRLAELAATLAELAATPAALLAAPLAAVLLAPEPDILPGWRAKRGPDHCRAARRRPDGLRPLCAGRPVPLRVALCPGPGPRGRARPCAAGRTWLFRPAARPCPTARGHRDPPGPGRGAARPPAPEHP